MARKPKKPPAWIRDGAAILYRASPAPGWTFRGVVDGEPWLLSGHTWVVRLREMEKRYRNGARSTVSAAACDVLSRAPVEVADG
jgi:hypothetical protein